MTKLKFFRSIFVITMVGLIGSFSLAQETLPQEKQEYNKEKIRFFGVSLSYYDIDFGQVNSFLENSGMPTVQDGLRSMLTARYSEKFITKNLYFDVSLATRISGTKYKDNYALKQSIVLLDLGFRYAVLDKNDHNLSFGAYWGNISHRMDIDNVLPNQQSDRIEKTSNFVGVKAMYVFHDFVYFNLGYRFDVGSQRISINGHDYSDSPKLSAEGLFFGIGIGGF